MAPAVNVEIYWLVIEEGEEEGSVLCIFAIERGFDKCGSRYMRGDIVCISARRSTLDETLINAHIFPFYEGKKKKKTVP